MHLVERQSRVGSGGGHFEHRQVAGDAAALLDLVGAGAGDVVGDRKLQRAMPLSFKRSAACAEVQHVTGVVAEAEQHAGRRRDAALATEQICWADGEAKMLPTAAPCASPGPTRPAKAG